jgi:hypothetical protein
VPDNRRLLREKRPEGIRRATGDLRLTIEEAAEATLMADC